MRLPQMLMVLRENGFFEGRHFGQLSKSAYCKRFPKNLAIFNAQVFARRGRILKHIDLDLTLEAEALTAAARAIGENLYFLEEHRPCLGWQRESGSLIPVLRDAVWWTRIRPEDSDIFLPFDASTSRPGRTHLACCTGFWQGRPAYSVDVWSNPDWYNQHTSGAVIELCGQPPQHLRVGECVKEADKFASEPCRTRGRVVRPMFRQKSGLNEFVWFSNRVAVPSVLFDNSVGLLDNLTFTCHAGCEAIHIRRGGEFIGLIWPCSIHAPDLTASAMNHLKSLSLSRTQ